MCIALRIGNSTVHPRTTITGTRYRYPVMSSRARRERSGRASGAATVAPFAIYARRGASPPFRLLPPGFDCAGEARARSGPSGGLRSAKGGIADYPGQWADMLLARLV